MAAFRRKHIVNSLALKRSADFSKTDHFDFTQSGVILFEFATGSNTTFLLVGEAFAYYWRRKGAKYAKIDKPGARTMGGTTVNGAWSPP